MTPPGSNGFGSACQSHDIRRHTSIRSFSVAQLAIVIESPTFDAAGRSQGAGMALASFDINQIGEGMSLNTYF